MLSRKHLLLLVLLASSLMGYSQNIFRTACNGNVNRLDSLLFDNPINIQDDRGRSLLHWSVACRQDSIFHHLVDKGIDLQLRDNEGLTALHMAVRFGNEKFYQLLLGLNTGFDWQKQDGPAMLETAILKRNKEFISRLINDGVDINQVNKRGSTPLEIANRIQEPEISDLLLSLGADMQLLREIRVSGPYMGQADPGKQATLFAPNFVSTEASEFGSIFNKSLSEFYYAVDVNGKNEIRFSEKTDSQWSSPVVILSHESYGFNDPFLSPDESRLFFISNMPTASEDSTDDIDIWYVDKLASGWSDPINAGPSINSPSNEYYISFTDDGTMFFSSNINASEDNRSNYNIFYSPFIDGKFQKSVELGSSINTDAYEADVFVAPDASYLIFCATRSEGFGRGDLYISFKKENGDWSESLNMGESVNTEHHELCPFVTADGKYLLYTSQQDIYWISTEIIDDLKSKFGK